MVKLFCAIVNEACSAFSVRVDESDEPESVYELKKAIKNESPETIKGDPKDLQLFLAKTGNKWLNWADVAAMALEKAAGSAVPVLVDDHGNRHDFVKMDPLLWIKNPKHFGANFQPGEGQVHVLVVPSEGATGAEVTQSTKLSTLSMMLKQCKVSGDLPQQGDFLKLFEWTDGDCGKVMTIKEINDIVHFTGSKFYVRKEILCVLEIFMNVYRNEFDKDEVVNKQFILLGSPGTGKSCILALICFYVAVHYKKPVVWFRQVIDGLYPTTTTRLFYQGKYYEWEDAKGEIYEALYYAMGSSGIDPIKCWFCLDGITLGEIMKKEWFNQYKFLATSGQFWPKSEAVPFLKMCLLPYWRQRDLEDFGLNHMQMPAIDVDARFFVAEEA